MMKEEILHRRKCKPSFQKGGRLLFHPETGKEIIRGLDETDNLPTLNGLGLFVCTNLKFYCAGSLGIILGKSMLFGCMDVFNALILMSLFYLNE